MLLHCDRALIDGRFRACDIRIADGRFQQIADEGSLRPTCGEAVLDLRGKTVLPGLIDSHIHGYDGADSMDATPEALQRMSQSLLNAGVTAFLPTTMTAKPETLLPALRCIGEMRGKTKGAKILGAFAEGPFITAEHRGAQPLDAIAEPNQCLLSQMTEAAGGALRKVILAPEAHGAAAFCRLLREQGIVPALGHSSASCAEALDCIGEGASVAVHTYNGMRGLHHREPGLLGAVLASDAIMAELILDGIHVHPTAAQILLRAKGENSVILISDCMRAGGMADGDYMLGDTKCLVRNGIARTVEGNLAGSTLALIDAVKNAVTLLGLPLETAVKLASENPAKSLGLFEELGSIAEGKCADLIAIDERMCVCDVLVDGSVKLSS